MTIYWKRVVMLVVSVLFVVFAPQLVGELVLSGNPSGDPQIVVWLLGGIAMLLSGVMVLAVCLLLLVVWMWITGQLVTRED